MRRIGTGTYTPIHTTYLARILAVQALHLLHMFYISLVRSKDLVTKRVCAHNMWALFDAILVFAMLVINDVAALQ